MELATSIVPSSNNYNNLTTALLLNRSYHSPLSTIPYRSRARQFQRRMNQLLVYSNGMSNSNSTEDEEEDYGGSSSSTFLSLIEKLDRNMALLDDYELEELDFLPDPNHRSALNMADLAISLPLMWYEKNTDVDEVIPVSAKYDHGVDDIKDWILSKLPLGPAYYPKDITSEHPERFFIGQIVREKIFMQFHNEVPYACQVNVINYKARPSAKDFIQIEIIVEKDTQKIILIGKDGKALKLLATAARLDIEDFLQKNVFLEVEVKVKEHWRQDERLLRYYGYGGKIQAL